MKNGRYNLVPVSDDRLLRREIVNNNKFRVFARLDPTKILYVNATGITLGPAEVVIDPGKSAVLNHGFYIMTGEGLPQGEPFDLVVKLGKNIGDGDNRPSLPTFDA